VLFEMLLVRPLARGRRDAHRLLGVDGRRRVAVADAARQRRSRFGQPMALLSRSLDSSRGVRLATSDGEGDRLLLRD
jgi:hypothetical protein